MKRNKKIIILLFSVLLINLVGCAKKGGYKEEIKEKPVVAAPATSEPIVEEPLKEPEEVAVAPVAEEPAPTPIEEPKTEPAKTEPAPTAPAPTTETPAPPPAPTVDPELQRALDTSVPNNGKFDVTFESTSGPAPAELIYYINNIDYTKEKGVKIKSIVAYNGRIQSVSLDPFYGFMIDENGQYINKFKGLTMLQAWDNTLKTVDVYLFIKSQEDGKTYCHKANYNITSIK